jgi:hypothetical protein
MSAIQLMSLTAAAAGILGTALLFLGTYGFEPREGAAFYGPILEKWNKGVESRNATRRRQQRIGLVLLGVSFLLQGAVAFLI